MPRWSKDETEFIVSVIENKGAKTRFSNIPKPVLEFLNDPENLRFKLVRGKVIVEGVYD